MQLVLEKATLVVMGLGLEVEAAVRMASMQEVVGEGQGERLQGRGVLEKGSRVVEGLDQRVFERREGA